MKQLWVWMLLALTGCAQVPTVQSPGELSSTHGFVHVMMPTVQSGYVSLRAMGKDGQYTLISQPTHGPSAYGLWVPPGEYQVAGFVNPDGSKYLPVNVSQGRVTDLGGVVQLKIGGYESVWLPIRHPEIAVETQRAIDKLRPHLADAEPLEWKPLVPPRSVERGSASTGLGLIADLLQIYLEHVNKPPLNKQLKETKTIEDFFQLAATAIPPQTEEPGVDDRGNLYYGAELGRIRVRSPAGQWSSLDTGTLQTVTAIETYRGGLVAGTSQGDIRVSRDGKNWEKRFAFSESETVVDIDRIGERWIVLTTRITSTPIPTMIDVYIHSVDSLKVYTTTADDLATLRLLREINLPEKLFLVFGMGVRGQHAAGTYYVNVGKELLKLDLATMQWSSATPGNTLTGFNISPKTGFLTAYRSQGIFSKLHVSGNQGVTWRPVDTPPYTFYDVYFESEGKGHATRFSMGAFSSSIEFMTYDPAADRWQKTHDAPRECRRILRDGDNVQRFCLTNGNTILNYVDGKWAVEFGVN
jgi:hypothetical protein